MSNSQARARWSLSNWLGYHIEKAAISRLWRIGSRQAQRQWARRMVKLDRKYGR